MRSPAQGLVVKASTITSKETILFRTFSRLDCQTQAILPNLAATTLQQKGYFNVSDFNCSQDD